MFFLGQSASYLPYIIIALTYIAGLAGYSMGIIQNNDGESTQEKKLMISQEESVFFIATDENETYISNHSQKSTDLFEIDCLKPPMIRAFNKILQKNPLHTSFLVNQEGLSQFFLRPPPVC